MGRHFMIPQTLPSIFTMASQHNGIGLVVPCKFPKIKIHEIKGGVHTRKNELIRA